MSDTQTADSKISIPMGSHMIPIDPNTSRGARMINAAFREKTLGNQLFEQIKAVLDIRRFDPTTDEGSAAITGLLEVTNSAGERLYSMEDLHIIVKKSDPGAVDTPVYSSDGSPTPVRDNPIANRSRGNSLAVLVAIEALPDVTDEIKGEISKTKIAGMTADLKSQEASLAYTFGLSTAERAQVLKHLAASLEVDLGSAINRSLGDATPQG